MNILFVGGEDSDFFGVPVVDTSTPYRRANYTRCALMVSTGSAPDLVIKGLLSALASDFWLTARMYSKSYYLGGVGNNNDQTSDFVAFYDANGVKRLAVRQIYTDGYTYSSYTVPLGLYKYDATGTRSTLIATTQNIPIDAVVKLDFHVKYGVDGLFEMYNSGALMFSYAGDLTTNGVTALGSFGLGHPSRYNSYGSYCDTWWSEVIVADADTRSLSLITIAPAVNGAAFQFSGATSDVSEVTTNDSTAITTTTPGQIAESTVTPASVLSASTPIQAVIVSARAQKGASGPQKLDMVVRSGGADYTSADIALQNILSTVQGQFPINPATGQPWTGADILAAGFNIGMKSVA